jgi:hypothetical protein
VETRDVSLISRGEIARALPMKRCIELARVAYEATATGKALDKAVGSDTLPSRSCPRICSPAQCSSATSPTNARESASSTTHR